MFKKTDYLRAVPMGVTPHQLFTIGNQAHDLVNNLVENLDDEGSAELNPSSGFDLSRSHDASIQAIVSTLDIALDRLALALGKRRVKSARNLRGVGDVNGTSHGLSLQKREVYQERRGLMRRLRTMIAWSLRDYRKQLSHVNYLAADHLNEMILKRIDGFETLSYEESAAEFRLFFHAVSEDHRAVAAIHTLGLDELYEKLVLTDKNYHDVHDRQAEANSLRAQQPKITQSTRDIRHVMRVLLTMLHFTVETGDETFKGVLAQIDVAIGKVHKVAERRETMAVQEAGKETENDEANNSFPVKETQEEDLSETELTGLNKQQRQEVLIDAGLEREHEAANGLPQVQPEAAPHDLDLEHNGKIASDTRNQRTVSSSKACDKEAVLKEAQSKVPYWNDEEEIPF